MAVRAARGLHAPPSNGISRQRQLQLQLQRQRQRQRHAADTGPFDTAAAQPTQGERMEKAEQELLQLQRQPQRSLRGATSNRYGRCAGKGKGKGKGKCNACFKALPERTLVTAHMLTALVQEAKRITPDPLCQRRSHGTRATSVYPPTAALPTTA